MTALLYFPSTLLCSLSISLSTPLFLLCSLMITKHGEDFYFLVYANSFPCEKCICSWQQVTSLKLHTAHLNTHTHAHTTACIMHGKDLGLRMLYVYTLLNWSLLWQKPQINVAINFRNHCTKSTKVAHQLLDKHTVTCTHTLTHTCIRVAVLGFIECYKSSKCGKCNKFHIFELTKTGFSLSFNTI